MPFFLKFMRPATIVWIGTIAILSACSSKQDLGARCVSASDCPASTVCIAAGGRSACQPTCSASADECGGNASCGGVGSLSINVCQPTPQESDPPTEAEQPRIPCRTDRECDALHAGAICAEYQGVYDCTIPCGAERDCDVPRLGGFQVDFMTCAPDEGAPSRRACLPDAECFSNPLACVNGSSGADAGFPGTDVTAPDDAGLPNTNSRACADDDECPGGYGCSFEKQCVTSCELDLDCKIDFDCDSKTGDCVPS